MIRRIDVQHLNHFYSLLSTYSYYLHVLKKKTGFFLVFTAANELLIEERIVIVKSPNAFEIIFFYPTGMTSVFVYL